MEKCDEKWLYLKWELNKKKFVKDISDFREKNKNKKDFFTSVKKYSLKAAQNYINEFMKNDIFWFRK